jgi:hypothetical protein
MPQSMQPDPPAPHAPELVIGTHVVPEQHPEHDWELQTQVPLSQICPAAHAAFAPHRQLPPVQLSADVASQATQAAPSRPHVGNADALHVESLAQHPAAHEDELQTQLPPEQTCPVLQAKANPHRQTPDVEQLSALVGSQPVQASPSAPQVVSVGLSQMAPEQHPVGQFAAVQPVHAPASQLWPGGHCSHDDPLAPHAAAVFPGRHFPAEQQPVGHDVTLQAQEPFEQI